VEGGGGGAVEGSGEPMSGASLDVGVCSLFSGDCERVVVLRLSGGEGELREGEGRRWSVSSSSAA
jgi:hypothetical protein